MKLCPQCAQPLVNSPCSCEPVSMSGDRYCSFCNGTGYLVRYAGGGGTVAVREPCSFCLGLGKFEQLDSWLAIKRDNQD